MAGINLPPWKSELIDFALSNNILTFGTYELKSHRISPYFVNCGLFCRAKLIRAISLAYARTLHSYCSTHPDFEFDVLFGPAYKGIPLCATDLLERGELEWPRSKGRRGFTNAH